MHFQTGNMITGKRKGFTSSLIMPFIVLTLIMPLLSSVLVKADAVVEIRDWHDLDAVRDNLGGNYVLMNDLDATTAGYLELASEVANQGKGWQPIGIYQEGEAFDPFTGSFDGQGYEIRDLYINRPEEDGVGLFCAVVAGGDEAVGIINNVGVANIRVTGHANVGGLAGFSSGNISNSYCTGQVAGNQSVGGLVGLNAGNVKDSYSGTAVSGGWFVGGLAGYNLGGTVCNCHATGAVTADMVVGGLVGYNQGSVVSNCHSDASVKGDQGVGGLVGGNDGSLVRNSYAAGNVSGRAFIGGLVGHNWNWDAVVGSCYSQSSVAGNSSVGGLVGYSDYYATVDRCYALSSVTGNSSVGGLVGHNRGTVRESYAGGTVAGNSSVGGLVGKNEDTVKNSFWDRQTTALETSDGGTGRNTTEMMDITTYTDATAEGLDGTPWDIIAVAPGETNDAHAWNIVQGESYPFLSGKQFILYKLTIASTSGGRVISPGRGVHTYHDGEVVELVVEPDEFYRFVNWSGDIGTVADVTATNTTITMNSDYSIKATFRKATNWPLVALIVAGVIAVGFLLWTRRPQKLSKPPRLRRP